MAALLLVGACSDGDDGGGADQAGPDGGPTTVDLPPPSIARSDDEAVADALALVEERTPDATDLERDCVAHRIATDVDLASSVVEAQDGDGGVQTELASCRQALPFGEAFAQGIAADRGGALSVEQVTCLRDRFIELSGGDLDALVAAGVDPTGPEAARGVAVVGDITDQCGVPT